MDLYTLMARIGLIRAEEAGSLEDDIWLDYSTRSPVLEGKVDMEIKQDPD